MREFELMSSYFKRKNLTNNSSEAGAEVKDDDLVFVLLAGLPDSYENINIPLENQSNDKFTNSEVKQYS